MLNFAVFIIALASVVAAVSVAWGVFVLYAKQVQLLERDLRLKTQRAQREADAPPAPPPAPAPVQVVAAPAPPAAPPPPIVITIPVPMQPAAAAAPQAPLSAQPMAATGGQQLSPKLVAVLTAAVAVAVGKPFVIRQITALPPMAAAPAASTWKERGRLNIHDSHSPRKRSR